VSNLTSHAKSFASRILLCSFLFIPALALAHTVNLSWDASTSQVKGYNIYRGPNLTGPFQKINSILDPNTIYSDTTVQSGQTYFYVTTAVGKDGVESKYSNETEAVIPAGGSGSEAVLYSFAGGTDPKFPYAGLIFDKAGNLYGTTEFGGAYSLGTVFEMIHNSDGSWSSSVLYSFTGGGDGGQPAAGLIFDAVGNLYGTTNFGGSTNCNLGCGTVFKLSPASGSWTETVLYTFTGGADGREPYARLLFDTAGNLYGTTLLGGNIGSVCSSGCGTVFKLTSTSGGWTESVPYAFAGGTDGASPYDGLVADRYGRLYGSTYAGGVHGAGTIFRLSGAKSGNWTEIVLHNFGDGYGGKNPYGDVLLDAAGNIYGTAYQGGGRGYGVVFELLPTSTRGWTEQILHTFVNTPAGNPVAGLVMDATGTLFGTTMLSADHTSCAGGCGTLFKLAPASGGGWTYKVIHDFGQGTDGYHPTGDLILDQSGDLFGTTQAGGAQGSGMVFEIMH
jgi:uncharacterized repeat protein (TIGR03803 family)